jgi:16S rRNA C1402 N4-methylase RsmH
VDEGLELLTGMEAGELHEDGTFATGSFNEKVLAKLKQFNETLRSDKDSNNKETGEK